jgi:hypothetical protein
MTLPVQSKLILDKLIESNDKKLIVKVPLRKLKGEKGDQGLQGETGPQGSKGDNGEQGIQGPKGDTGSQGAKGDTGAQGLKGDTGAQGLKGDTGAQGAKGDTGTQGAKGDTGTQGIQGPKGDTGTQGIQGPKGDTGTQGIQGNPGVDAVAIGAINVAIRSVNSLALTAFTVGTVTIPYNATITGWDITSDISGSCVVDFKVGSYSNFPTNSDLFSSNKPNLNSSLKNTIGGLNIAVSAGQLITCLLQSVTGNLKRIDVTLKITKS